MPVGEVGEISFWSPNRGLLITGGAGPVSSGLYAYDGVSWHQLATVCGGSEGRIAWAGSDEFWTISDQRPGQVLPPGGQRSLHSISLCHFLDGHVVGSYAMPLDEANSYLQMDAAACYGPNDCWFGGEDGSSPNAGAFHLHWNGSTVTAVYEPEDHAVTGMLNFAGQIYESVQIEQSDAFLSSENREHPAVLHTIAPIGSEPIFEDVPIYSGKYLPEYGHDVPPYALGGFSLGSNGSPLGAGATELWGAANPQVEGASLTVLRYEEESGTWSQVLGAGKQSPLRESDRLAGAPTPVGTSGAIAPEPGSESAWLSLKGASGGAEVAELRANGTLAASAVLPEAGEPVGFRGEAGAITCAASHDCWLATTSGWLFHLTDGTPLPPDTDPFFDGEEGVITYRPPDSGLPVIYPYVPPADDSLANQQQPPAPTSPPKSTPTSSSKQQTKGKPLVTHTKSRFLHHRVLVISFTLTARAHVQLIGRRGKLVVASTRPQSLRPGHHELSLSFNPRRWPTRVQFKATPIGGSAPSSSAGGGGSGNAGPNTVST